MSTPVTLLCHFSIYAFMLPLLVLFLEFAQRRWFGSQVTLSMMDLVPWPNKVLLRSIYFSLLATVQSGSSTLSSVKENWMYESVGDGNEPFPYWWLITTVAIAAIIGGNLFVFLYQKYFLGNSPPTNAG